jgi:hypothetical protein
MTTARHRASARIAARSGKVSRLAVIASTATVAVVTVGVAAAPSDSGQNDPTQLASSIGAAPVGLAQLAADRQPTLSRTSQRVSLTPKATGHKFATAPLNVWLSPREQGKRLGLLTWGTKIAVTGQVVGHWAEVLLPDGKHTVVRWVNADYLANKKPKPEPAPSTTDTSDSSGATSSSTTSSAPTTTGLSSAPCPDGSATESGLTSSAVRLYRAVCAAFPALTTYGGYDPHGEHASGRAIDFMISDPSLGQAVAYWVQAHASELGIYDIIWQQHIWTPVRASEGWRYMPDRGSATANHYDHVHVSVY